MATLSSKELVTVDQVKKALKADKGQDAHLLSWKIIDFNKPGQNFSSYVTSILVSYSMNGRNFEVSYVAKINPCKPFESNPLGGMNKEADFLMVLIPQMNSVLSQIGMKSLQFSNCFHSDLEIGKEQIYLEDLRARNFVMVDKKKGLSVEHTILVLKELAKFHAAWKVLQVKCSEENIDQKYDLVLQNNLVVDEKTRDLAVQVIEGNFTLTMKILRNHGRDERAIQWIENLKPKIKEIIIDGIMSENFEAVCHGDCWNNNILFRHDSNGIPLETILLDLEVCRKASLALDLNYLLYTSVAGDVRKTHFTHFLDSYYSSYSQVIEAGGLTMHFSREELETEFRHKNVVGALYGMLVLPAVFAEEVHMPDISEFAGDFERYCNEFRDRIVKSMDDNPMTEPRYLAMFDEFMETGLIP